MKEILIAKINKSGWWHVPPRDKNAYKKRGKFLASTYLQAEFYGRPIMEPEKIDVQNPVFGFSENEILNQLFEDHELELVLKLHNDLAKTKISAYEKRIVLDGLMYQKAKHLEYDAIVLMTKSGKKALERSHKPRCIELNLIN